MNWAAWGPTIVAMVTAIFMAGQNYRTIKDVKDKVGLHDIAINDLEIRQARMESWREGYAAGSAKTRGHEAPRS